MQELNEAEAAVAGPADRIPRANAWAWGLCWLMFASTVLNYMDRQTITLVKDQVATAFAITSDLDFGWVLAAFSMTYALFQVPAGYLVDRWDLRWSYAAAVAWWSLAAMAIALVPNLGMLIVCRALLGMGESFNWPCALRVTARVLPPADRSLGNGIFNSGAAVGAVVTPLVVTNLTLVLRVARGVSGDWLARLRLGGRLAHSRSRPTAAVARPRGPPQAGAPRQADAPGPRLSSTAQVHLGSFWRRQSASVSRLSGGGFPISGSVSRWPYWGHWPSRPSCLLSGSKEQTGPSAWVRSFAFAASGSWSSSLYRSTFAGMSSSTGRRLT